MFPGLELYALFVTQVMPGAIDKESQVLMDKYLENINRAPLGIAGQVIAYNPDMLIMGEGAGRRKEVR